MEQNLYEKISWAISRKHWLLSGKRDKILLLVIDRFFRNTNVNSQRKIKSLICRLKIVHDLLHQCPQRIGCMIAETSKALATLWPSWFFAWLSCVLFTFSFLLLQNRQVMCGGRPGAWSEHSGVAHNDMSKTTSWPTWRSGEPIFVSSIY